MENQMEKAISKLLRQNRRYQDLTQQQLSDKLGIKRVTYAHYETSGRLQGALLLMIIHELKIPFKDIMKLVEDEIKETSRAKHRKEMEDILNDNSF